MSLEKFYVVASFLVAICVWLEAQMLLKNSGKLPQKSIFAMIGLLTSVWLLISVAALYFLEFDRFSISVPVVYIIYSVMGWVYSTILMKGQEIPNNPKDFVIPTQYLMYSKSFAWVFATLCLFVLVVTYA